jgi:hypothetical protein
VLWTNLRLRIAAIKTNNVATNEPLWIETVWKEERREPDAVLVHSRLS